MHTPIPRHHFPDDLKTVAVVLLFLALIFAPSVGFTIWGEAGLS